MRQDINPLRMEPYIRTSKYPKHLLFGVLHYCGRECGILSGNYCFLDPSLLAGSEKFSHGNTRDLH